MQRAEDVCEEADVHPKSADQARFEQVPEFPECDHRQLGQNVVLVVGPVEQFEEHGFRPALLAEAEPRRAVTDGSPRFLADRMGRVTGDERVVDEAERPQREWVDVVVPVQIGEPATCEPGSLIVVRPS